MEHESFPVGGFEFINEPATVEQKEIIIRLCAEKNIALRAEGPWPKPFTKWDAGRMIDILKEKP